MGEWGSGCSGVEKNRGYYRGKNMKKKILIIAWLVVLLLIPIRVVVQNSMHSAILSWDENEEPDLLGYKIYFGNQSRNYHTVIDVGNVATKQIEGLTEGIRWYFAATAYDTAANESGYSNEVWILFSDSTAVDSLSPVPPYNLKVREK